MRGRPRVRAVQAVNHAPPAPLPAVRATGSPGTVAGADGHDTHGAFRAAWRARLSRRTTCTVRDHTRDHICFYKATAR
ncbi:hypothetical protein BconGalA64_49990 [Burkholderia contaminans]|nr:hypothetical protein BconGalA64_49990 [Burkholderia contaminans]